MFLTSIKFQSRMRTWAHHHFLAIISWCANVFSESNTTGKLFFQTNVQRRLIWLAVLGLNYNKLSRYIISSYLTNMVITRHLNGGGIWCCWGDILISPDHSCWFLSPTCLSQTWGNVLASFGVTDLISVVTAPMGGHQFLGNQNFQPLWIHIF